MTKYNYTPARYVGEIQHCNVAFALDLAEALDGSVFVERQRFLDGSFSAGVFDNVFIKVGDAVFVVASNLDNKKRRAHLALRDQTTGEYLYWDWDRGGQRRYIEVSMERPIEQVAADVKRRLLGLCPTPKQKTPKLRLLEAVKQEQRI